MKSTVSFGLVFYFQETLVRRNKVEKVCKKISFAKYFAVDAQGHGGGLALFWRNDEGVNILSSCGNFIDFECTHKLWVNKDTRGIMIFWRE